MRNESGSVVIDPAGWPWSGLRGLTAVRSVTSRWDWQRGIEEFVAAVSGGDWLEPEPVALARAQLGASGEASLHTMHAETSAA